jgi:hypothetical protein
MSRFQDRPVCRPPQCPFMVDEAFPAWLCKLMKTSHSVWRFAHWRGLVHGLATSLVLIAAETLIGGQQQQTSVLEIPKFFTERGPNGITRTTGDSYWLASRYVDHRVLTAIETVDDDEYFTGWSSMTDFYPPYRDGKSNRENLAAMLLTVLNDPETQKLAKCCAAAYLGILRAPEAEAAWRQISLIPSHVRVSKQLTTQPVDRLNHSQTRWWQLAFPLFQP